MRKIFLIPLVTALLSASVSAGTFYNSESSFLAATQANPYLEDFSSFTSGDPLDGSQLNYVAPGANGFGWTATQAGGLYSITSGLSTNNAQDQITITFIGNPVTAFGGHFTPTDISGQLTLGTIGVLTSDGGSQSIINPDASSFLGYTSTVPITSVVFSSPVALTWATIDHFFTGAALPEPMSLSLLAICGAGLLCRKRA